MPGRLLRLVPLIVVLALAGCGGSGEEATKTATTTASGSQIGGSSLVLTERRSGLAGVPASALPGITVLGTGERSAPADGALIALTIGAGETSFGGSGGPRFSVVQEDELEPAVDALKKAGAEDLKVDRFGGRSYGPFGQAAQVSFEARQAGDVDKLLEAAQDGLLDAHSEYGVQSASVVFVRDDCDRLEQGAWKEALGDARRRAERMASLAGVKVGRLLAVSEATTSPTPYGAATTGCESFRPDASPYVTARAIDNTPDDVEVAVTLQVTYAVDDQ